MAKALTPDICVIGAGPVGIALATKAAAYGASVVLVDGLTSAANLARGPMPPTALAATARHAQSMREGARFGLAEAEPEIDFRAVLARVQKIMADAAPAVSVERLATLGVTAVDGQPRFLGRRRIMAGDTEIRARRYVLATGSSPVIPSIPGLEDVGYLTADTVYDLVRKPSHLVILGDDATALQLAQAFNRLGTQVTLLAEANVLPEEDPEMASVLLRRLRAEGVDIKQGVKVTAVERRGKTGRQVADPGG
jgi:pyruvate/2-oxoglutarate dehydrogenase complex dihydrolipoamide dehydrogenase (E3) component